MLSRLQFYWQYLRTDPVGFVIYAVYFTVVILTSLILHEISHGYVALKCGDPTAKWMGRLSLDPRKHLDPLGTVFMLVLGFGWAKPVPVNPRNFRDYRRDDFYVSIAGICTNLTLFVLCTALSVLCTRLIYSAEFLTSIKEYYGSLEFLISPYYTAGYNMMNGNWSGMTQWMSQPFFCWFQRFFLLMGQVNLSLAVFNLLPIPPLDGYHLVNDLLLKGRLQLDRQAFRFAQYALMFLCFSGALSSLLSTVNTTVYSAVLNVFLKLSGGA